MKYWGVIVLFYLLLANIAYAPGVSAEIYKWTDENGNVHYADRPGIQNAEKIALKKSKAEDPSLRQQRKRQLRMLEIYQEERQDKQQLQAKAEQQKKLRKANCAKTKAELEVVRNTSFLYVDTDDALNPHILTDEARDQAIARIESDLKHWCK